MVKTGIRKRLGVVALGVMVAGLGVLSSSSQASASPSCDTKYHKDHWHGVVGKPNVRIAHSRVSGGREYALTRYVDGVYHSHTFRSCIV